jgi:methyl-accepting chemotaxis protein
VKIRAKLLAGFLSVAVLCGAIGLMGILQLSTLQRDLTSFSTVTLPTLNALEQISYNLAQLKGAIRSISNPLGVDDDVYYKRQISNINTYRDAYNKAIADFESTPDVAEEERLWEAFKVYVPKAKEYNDNIIALVEQARAFKGQIALQAAAPAAAPARGAAPLPATASAAAARAAIFEQIYTLISGDQRLVYDDMLAALAKVTAYDDKYYGHDQTEAAISAATTAIIVMIIIAVVIFGLAIAIGVILGNSISKSLRLTVDKVNKIAAGDLSEKLDIRSTDEFGELARSVNVCIDSIKALATDADMLAKAAVEGKLATRADASKHQGDYRRVVEGVNNTLNSVIGPLNVAANYVDRISKGDLPPKITDSYNGDFNEIKNNLNTAIGSIGSLVTDADMLAKAAVEGNLETRADASKHQGDYRKIVEGVNRTLDAVIGPLNVTADYVDKVAKGVIPPEITTDYKGQYNVIKQNLNTLVRMMAELLFETDKIVKAAAEGRLTERADAAKFVGGWHKLVSGVNDTITNIVDPLNVTADYVDKVSKGVIPPEITTQYQGQYNVIKQNLNNMVRMMSELLAETDKIVKAAAEGRLAERADAAKFVGGWNKLVSGVNDTITNIVDPLNVTADYVDKVSKGVIPPEITTEYKGQYNVIKQNLNNMVRMMAELLAETDKIVKAAAEGRLSERADAAKFVGGWHKLVSGVNDTITNIVDPLNVTADYVDKVSKGIIPPEITTEYKGQYNVIKQNLNTMVRMMADLLSETDKLVKGAAAGQLGTRADAAKFQGGWKELVAGINETLATVITPVNETIEVLKHLAEGDLTVLMAGAYKGDFDVLKSALNASLESINDILSQVTMAVDQVTAGSQQVSQASQSLSQGATEQASSLEEITSSITEVSSQTKQNTDNAIQVNGLAKTARDDAEQGNNQMKDLVAAMSDINKSAEEIRKIVKAIDDISFQINLLALNANVEAARAGKYGKGFAVVAEEVRNLAVRSANSVKETTRMVDDTIANIERGNGLVTVTAKQLDSIVGGAANVAGLAEQVSAASKEQALGLEQVATGLNQIDQVTQANTASAEESASAAEELSSQSQQLKAMLTRFKLRATEGKASNAEVLAMLRAELARQNGLKTAAPVHAAGAKPQARRGGGQNPADLISLDDGDFGKF